MIRLFRRWSTSLLRRPGFLTLLDFIVAGLLFIGNPGDRVHHEAFRRPRLAYRQRRFDVIPQATVAIGASPQAGLNTLWAMAPRGAFTLCPVADYRVDERIFGTLIQMSSNFLRS